MNKIVLPTKLIELFKQTGVMSLGERHGIKENYEIYENILKNLPEKPNLALEFGYFDKVAFEDFNTGNKIDINSLSDDGRISLEYFNFLKKYLEDNPETKLIYLGEFRTADPIKSGDEQYADYFLETFKKPTVIICGETHARKENIIWSDGFVQKPMGAFIKEKIGDFPNIKIIPTSGKYYSFGINEIPVHQSVCGEVIDKGNNNYEYNFEKATPTTPF
jgi:hypothetical protein